MNYKIVAFDMDGTLLNSQRQIPQNTMVVLDQIRQAGIDVVLVTGRHHTAVYPYVYQLQLATPAICCNGTYLYDFQQKRALAANPLSKEKAHQLMAIVRQHGIHTLVYADDAMTYEVLDDHMRSFNQWANSVPEIARPKVQWVDSFDHLIDHAQVIWKFATSHRNIAELRAFAHAVQDELGLSCEWSWHDRVDVAEAGNSKGNRLKEWVESQGLSMANVVAFGDNYNDSSMLQMAGLGIAMGNSDQEVQQMADRVIGNNDSDAIATTLKELFLSK